MKRTVIILLAMMALLPLSAQKIVKSTGQKITESAIQGSCVVVRQSYQIKNKKTGIVYGRNGRDEFGKSYRSVVIGTSARTKCNADEIGIKLAENIKSFLNILKFCSLFGREYLE